ncbi:aspartate aminotransferase family protein [Micromonospora sp. URMC 105]|uniref:aspartate aminotransferase family protein n=1 Tax=Micromonospora sp. URMC 105 TaxID=3423413 RepID=UPI003F1C9984
MAAVDEPELAEAHLRQLLGSLGLDVNYVRGQANTLYFLDDGREHAVVDFVGGYGSLIFGHNNPTLVAYAKQLLDAQIPFHAQFSYHPYANDLATALNRVHRREFRTDENYRAIFANSGAEAVETALKHAEMDRSIRLAALGEEIHGHVEEAQAAVAAGSAVVADHAYDELGVTDRSAGALERLVEAIHQHNEPRFLRQPLFLTLEGSFHGKLAGSLQLTHNSAYRLPFRALAAQARFLPFDQPGAVEKVLDEERTYVYDVVMRDGVVDVTERELPVIGGFFVEPIQGEGGIHEVGVDMAQAIRAAADTAGFPVILDEIQSGVGRSGAFFAGSHIGLRGDYYVLAKSLGGGLSKLSVLLVRDSLYRPDFELLHSSTFAKDAFSCHLGRKVVEMLEADGGSAYGRVIERGARLRAALERIRSTFPDVVKDCRGRGLMLGLEFQDQSTCDDEIIASNARNGLIGYVLAGYLLREHRVRVFPTASASHTLRFEPSVELTDDEIGQLESGLEATCRLLRERAGARLVGAA